SPGRVSIFSPEPSGKWQEAIIFPHLHYLEFSSAGKYFFSKYTVGGRDLLLWPRPEKLSDWSLNPFPTPHFDAASRARLNSVKVLQHKSFVGKVQFSPSDSHILVSSHTSHLLVNASTVAVYLWGKNQAGEWSIQTFTDHCTPAITPCFSLSGLHVLTCNPWMSSILGRSNQKQWSLKGVIKQHGLLKAYFNPLSEHEVVILSRTDNDTNITLTVWEITGTPD
ncbi:hypothetical protein, partial [Endozoicomonas sp. ONNA2]|uniref:hypothetical protein n=1 Tax=Endozoicomonas sp. ONNA2 TaxID=2828741 RepID=UPI002147E3E6